MLGKMMALELGPHNVSIVLLFCNVTGDLELSKI